MIDLTDEDVEILHALKAVNDLAEEQRQWREAHNIPGWEVDIPERMRLKYHDAADRFHAMIYDKTGNFRSDLRHLLKEGGGGIDLDLLDRL